MALLVYRSCVFSCNCDMFLILAEYFLTLVYQGGDMGESRSLSLVRDRANTAKLVSPSFVLNSTVCLRAKVYTAGSLRLDMWYKTDASVENFVIFDMPLTQPPLEDSFFWADIVADLRPVNEHTTEYRLVFTTTVTSYAAYYPFILDFLFLDPKPCASRIERGMVKINVGLFISTACVKCICTR